MKNKKMNRSVVLIALILLTGLIIACSTKSKKKNTMSDNLETLDSSFKQSEKDLLSGEYKAICYSGFRTGQHPDRGEGAKNPSAEQVLEDLQIIANDMGFKLLRLYDSGENSEMVLQLIQENKLDIKVMLGIWLEAELSAHETCEWLTEPIPQEELDENKESNLEELKRGINLSNKYKDIVAAVNIGNEALVEWNDHKMDVDTVIAYCSRVKKAIGQPITVADNYEWWAAHGERLAEVLDFISVHVYPVWEGKDIDEGLSYSIENIRKVRTALPKTKIVISEAGWASVASEFGERASEEKQLQYYNDMITWAEKMNITTFIFEAFDEDWKGDPGNAMGAEKHWGLYTVGRQPKKVMRQNKLN